MTRSVTGISTREVLQAAAIFFLSLFIQFVYFNFGIHRVSYNSDSVSYFVHVDLISGVLDLYRTPIYPYFLQFLTFISPDQLVRNCILTQHAIFALSNSVLFGILTRAGVKTWIAFGVTLLMTTDKMLLEQIININPEMFTVLASVLALAIFGRLPQPSMVKALLLGIFCFLLVMIKPVFIWLFLAVFCSLTVSFLLRPNGRFDFTVLYALTALSTVFFLLFCGYCWMNQQCNGDYTISRISVHNSIANVMASAVYSEPEIAEEFAPISNMFSTSEGTDAYEVVFKLDNYIFGPYVEALSRFPTSLRGDGNVDAYQRYENIVKTKSIPFTEVDLFLKNCKSQKKYWKYLILRAKNMIMNDYSYYVLICSVTFVLLIANFIHTDYVSHFATFSLIALSGFIFTLLIVVGEFSAVTNYRIAQPDRLMVPALPFYYALLAYAINVLWIGMSSSEQWLEKR